VCPSLTCLLDAMINTSTDVHAFAVCITNDGKKLILIRHNFFLSTSTIIFSVIARFANHHPIHVFSNCLQSWNALTKLFVLFTHIIYHSLLYSFLLLFTQLLRLLTSDLTALILVSYNLFVPPYCVASVFIRYMPTWAHILHHSFRILISVYFLCSYLLSCLVQQFISHQETKELFLHKNTVHWCERTLRKIICK
jgi:hypothetical protein